MALTTKAILCLTFGIVLLAPGEVVFGQGGRAGAVPKGAKVDAPDPTSRTLNPHQRFVYDVVRAAVALPQGNPQDRLRVLAAASMVIAPLRPTLAKAYSREGLRLEQELIQRGEQPATSMLSAGPVDCKAVQRLVESIPAQRVDAAEPSLVAAIGECPAVRLSAQRLVSGGLDEKRLAPRATLALMERAGLNSRWSQENFEKAFDSLPSNAESLAHEAPNIAAMYATAASAVGSDAAKKAGVVFLLWLGKLPESGDRTMAVNVTSAAMKQALGAKAYEEALASDMGARQVAQSSGGGGEISLPVEESASVLKAMQSAKDDRLTELQALPAPQRAREAAASGFASGTGDDRTLASRYFDLAFSSLNSVWGDRDKVKDAPGIVQEVSEAAAQVDSVDALRRTRELDDPAAQAIGMISVARVVAGGGETVEAER
jgi:hypothetical protein